MANRRLFSREITDSDPFLDMPATSQTLYFHLCMHADDDGFVGNPKTIKRMIGSTDDDLKLLASKGFIIPFEDGVIAIRDWMVHNTIKKDRYHETLYLRDKALLKCNDSKQYFLSNLDPKWNQSGTNPEPSCIQDGSKTETEVKLSKVKLSKPKLSNTYSATDVAPCVSNKGQFDQEFEELWAQYPNKKGKKDALNHYRAWRKKSVKHTMQYMQEKLNDYLKYCHSNSWYHPMNGSTWFNGRFEDDLTPSEPQKRKESVIDYDTLLKQQEQENTEEEMTPEKWKSIMKSFDRKGGN